MWESDTMDICLCSRLLSDLSCDKENRSQRLESPEKHDVEFSLYTNNSPRRERGSVCADFNRRIGGYRRPLGERNVNVSSHDSGYGTSSSFSVQGDNENSISFESLDCLDDDFSNIDGLAPLDGDCQLPVDFMQLINGRIQFSVKERKTGEEQISERAKVKRSLSLNFDERTPNSSRLDNKRLSPTVNRSPLNAKRCKILEDNIAVPLALSKPILERSVSISDDAIKSALQRSCTNSDLIGDFTKSFGLPLTPGKHPDLKSITNSTLTLLMKGRYSDISSFKIIDCRYPYEFDGGHINGALNIYTKDQIMQELLASDKIPNECGKRNILIFHCEFSSERGPSLYRFLRSFDRMRNNDVYPALHYPEMYVLEGGYKSFFENYSELCTPQSYKPMLHPEHQDDLKHFRTKAKKCNADRIISGKGSAKRSRLSFM